MSIRALGFWASRNESLTQIADKYTFSAPRNKASKSTTTWSVPQIRDDRFADICGQGQLDSPASLALDARGSGLPVNSLEFEEGHFAGT
jgi:hypothetical protein